MSQPKRACQIWRDVGVVLATAALGGCAAAPTAGSRLSTTMSPGITPPSASADPTPTPSMIGAVIQLRCSDGATGLVTPSDSVPVLMGLVSQLWEPKGLEALERNTGRPSYQGSTLVKSPLYATKDAKTGTRIRVESPPTAGLFYTTWAVWGSGDLTGRAVVTGARREVAVGGCGSETAGFPGGIVVKGPSCVTLRVTSPDSRKHQELTLPIGRDCTSN